MIIRLDSVLAFFNTYARRKGQRSAARLTHDITPITLAAPHVRDATNVTRVMNIVVLALFPCILFGIYNTGYQANVLMSQAGLQSAPGWHGMIIDGLGIGYRPENFAASVWHGLLIFLPILLTALIVAGLWEAVFVNARGGGRRGDFVLVALLFALSLPASVPLWQVALGITFGIVVGKEIFGGTGKNFLNPALTGLAFLYVTYPAQMVGETAWAVHGLSGATPLQTADRRFRSGCSGDRFAMAAVIPRTGARRNGRDLDAGMSSWRRTASRHPGRIRAHHGWHCHWHNRDRDTVQSVW